MSGNGPMETAGYSGSADTVKAPGHGAALTEISRYTGGAEELYGIARRCFSAPWSRLVFADMLEDDGCGFFCARACGAAVGFCAVRAAADEGELLDIAVLPDYRRRGIGAALLDAGIEYLRGAGAGRIFLEVRESNSAARGLYASRGFSLCGRRRNYYSSPLEDAVVMVLG